MPSASQLRARVDASEGLRRLRRADLPVGTVELARYLIGKVIVHDTAKVRLIGRIVETEAYPVGDAAGHAFLGRTPRNGSLFLERGHAYVYLAYGVDYDGVFQILDRRKLLDGCKVPTASPQCATRPTQAAIGR